jgi:hypothetical protein
MRTYEIDRGESDACLTCDLLHGVGKKMCYEHIEFAQKIYGAGAWQGVAQEKFAECFWVPTGSERYLPEVGREAASSHLHKRRIDAVCGRARDQTDNKFPVLLL